MLFKYLGRVVTAGGGKWTKVSGNLSKASKIWMRMTMILSREGAYMKVSGLLFKAVIQVVLLFGADTWVLTPWMERALSSFQHRVAQSLATSQPRRRGRGDGNILR